MIVTRACAACPTAARASDSATPWIWASRRPSWTETSTRRPCPAPAAPLEALAAIAPNVAAATSATAVAIAATHRIHSPRALMSFSSKWRDRGPPRGEPRPWSPRRSVVALVVGRVLIADRRQIGRQRVVQVHDHQLAGLQPVSVRDRDPRPLLRAAGPRLRGQCPGDAPVAADGGA